MTGLGTPVAGKLVPDLIAYAGPGTTFAGPTVGPLQDATLTAPGTAGGGPMDVFSVFDAMAVTVTGFGAPAARMTLGIAMHRAPDARDMAAAPHAIAVEGPVAEAPTPGIAAFGMVPMDDTLTVHEAALAGWSSAGVRSPGRVATRAERAGGPAVTVGVEPVPVRARPVVLQATAVDRAIEGLGALPSLVDSDGPTSTGSIVRTLRGRSRS